MTPRRWWERGQRSIEDEIAWFREDGLDFALDEEMLKKHDVVVFRGELSLDERRTPASVLYPPSYGSGDHPQVVAPDLPVGRHRAADGRLCLDHAVFGGTDPMCGAEAVQRAQRLWDLWENDREQLDKEEGDLPDPRVNHYEYLGDTAVTMIDMEVGDGADGYFQLRAHSLRPLRAVVAGIQVMRPQPFRVEPGTSLAGLAGTIELNGAWVRVDEPPPSQLTPFFEWLAEHHAPLARRQLEHAEQAARAQGRPEMPAVMAFVFPDEGPRKGEVHDAWVFCVIEAQDGGSGHIAKVFHLRSDERWLRQPQLQGLGDKKVTIIGAGALGSQVGDLLAKAGVGDVRLVDYDAVTHGIRVRHQLDLRDLGRNKAHALRDRLRAVNPWGDVLVVAHRLGAAGVASEANIVQEFDDTLVELMTGSDVIINTSASSTTGSYVSAIAAESDTTAVHGWVSAGAWGARIVIQRPGQSACWDCFALAQEHPDRYPEPIAVPDVADDPEVQQVAERGCADLTFTGPGFELADASAAIARVAVQLLLAAADGYPAADFDVATLHFRSNDSARPSAEYTDLPPHPDCPTCNNAS